MHPCLLQAANAVGYGGASYDEVLASVRVPQGRYDFFVELHIEQVGAFPSRGGHNKPVRVALSPG